MLEPESIVLIKLETDSAECTPKAIAVADGIKRARHRAGLDQQGRGLWMYVIDRPDGSSSSSRRDGAFAQQDGVKGPRVIDLNDKSNAKSRQKKAEGNNAWAAPPKITIYLSKIDLPDLHPSRQQAAVSSSTAPIAGNTTTHTPTMSHGHSSKTPRPTHRPHTNPSPGATRPTSTPTPQAAQASSLRPSSSPTPSSGRPPRPDTTSPHGSAQETDRFGFGGVRSKFAQKLFSSR